MSRAIDRSRFRALSAALVCGSLVAACSDMYYDRRDTVSFQAGDANQAVRHDVAVRPEFARLVVALRIDDRIELAGPQGPAGGEHVRVSAES